MASDFDWTAEAVTCLRAFWQDGHSTAEIGRRMGTSKNAVVGKAHRLGLPPRPSPIWAKGTGGTPRPPAPARTRSPGQPPPPVADSPPPERPPHPPAASLAPPARAAPLPPPPALVRPAGPEMLALSRPATRQPCCWPIGHPGTPGFRFCDATALPCKPYCAAHAGIAYAEPEAAHSRSDTAAPSRRSGAG